MPARHFLLVEIGHGLSASLSHHSPDASNNSRTTVDAQYLTSGPCRFVRSKIERHVGHMSRLNPAERLSLADETIDVFIFLRQRDYTVRPRRGWRQGIRPDPVGGVLGGDRPRDRNDAAFGRRVTIAAAKRHQCR